MNNNFVPRVQETKREKKRNMKIILSQGQKRQREKQIPDKTYATFAYWTLLSEDILFPTGEDRQKSSIVENYEELLQIGCRLEDVTGILSP